jgi:hypothetical protein
MALTDLLDSDDCAEIRGGIDRVVKGRICTQVGTAEYRSRLAAAVAAVATIMNEPYLDADLTAVEKTAALHTWAANAAVRAAEAGEREAHEQHHDLGDSCCSGTDTATSTTADRSRAPRRGQRMEYPVNSHAVYRLGDDQYVLWSSSADAPASTVLTLVEVWEAGITADRLALLLTRGHTSPRTGLATPAELVGANRAGPHDTCLTLEAILRRYATPESYRSFTLRPADIQPYLVTDHDRAGNETSAWVPWLPGEVPADLDPASALTDPARLHTMVPADPSGNRVDGAFNHLPPAGRV